ncbi:hypothetical protein D3C80_1902400 [compost metagenome]
MEFITPQPHSSTKSGRDWRTCSQVDFCSTPGAVTGISESSKPFCLARSCSSGIGSLPNGESWYTRAIFLPLSLSMPPSFLPMCWIRMSAAVQ